MMDKRYDHQKFEEFARNVWKEQNPYKFTTDASKKMFSIDTPPPTVSGALHIGHIFSYTHTDIIARYKRMQGFNVFYPMGFDDNGLPTERYVEKKHKTKAHLMKRSEFIALCLQESHEVEKMFEHLWRAMGLSIDWSLTYSTISDEARLVSQYSFIELYKKGLIYRKEEPALYCTTCRTSVAQAELDSLEVSTTFNDIAFTSDDGTPLLIATTRPELLPACVAVFFHPDDARYKHLSGKKAITPVFKKEVPILTDEAIDPEKGTGLVMCCTFGDQADIDWFKKHKLPFVQAIGFDGTWTKETGALAGLRVHDARKKMVELLKESGALKNQKTITHAVNVHERCKQEIEYLILTQWFVNILDHKEKFLELADQINWKPEFMKARYLDWVQNLGWDWNISRQRFYGIPFPVWHCQGCNEVLLADQKALPIDPQEQSYPGTACPQCNGTDIRPEIDVMDTWNTSSLTPQILVKWPNKYGTTPGYPTIPMTMRPQAHDIIRTWTFYTIVKSFYHHKTIPWNDIVISGHVLTGKEKISKSRDGNKLAPENILKTYPADAIRYWSACGRLGTDTAFSENQLKIGLKLLTKLWNAFRFSSDLISQHKRADMRPKLDTINQWLLHRLGETVHSYTTYFDEYEYQHALEMAETFFWHDFCDHYLELIKDQVFNPDNYDVEVLEAMRFTLYETSFGLLQLFAPFIPHITETLYQQLFKESEGSNSLHGTILDRNRFDFAYPQSAAIGKRLIELIGHVRKLKTENQLSLKTELATLSIHSSDEKILDELACLKTTIAGITKAATINFSKEPLKTASLQKRDDAWHAQVMV